MEHKLRKTIIAILIIFDSLILSNFIGGIIVYNAIFYRQDNVLNLTQKYDEKKYDFKQEIINIPTKNYGLQGYFYEIDKSRPLIVFVHGMKDDSNTLFNQQLYFINHNYNVFSFDMSGTMKSGGKINGFSQSLIDLEYVLKYLNTEVRFKNYKLLLYGFSSGGYAASSIFSLGDFNVYGSVCVSSFYSAKNIIKSKGYDYVGIISNLGEFVIDFMQNINFSSYLNYDSITAINNTNIPIFIAHSKKDPIISFSKDSIISKRDDIINPNVKYYIDENKGHLSIQYSNEAISYQENIKFELDKIKDEDEKKDYLNNISNNLFNELNLDLFNQILEFYESVI